MFQQSGVTEDRRARRPVRTAGGLALALLLAGLVAGSEVTAQADPAAWQQTGLAEPVQQLFTPASGAFFARTADALLRSNDGGVTWAPVTLPPPPTRRGGQWAAVDPTNHTVAYAAGAGGLYQTRDDAATWQVIQAGPNPSASVEAIAISPADPSVLYVYFLQGNTLHFYRTADGGASWTAEPPPTPGGPCTSRVALLQAHPTDPRRAFRAAGCYAGRNFGDALWQSVDGGATWSQSFREQGTIPARLAGGEGAAGAPFYLGAAGAVPNAPSILARSDDNAATWTSVQTYASSELAGTQLAGLAADPAAPSRVYLALGGLLHGVRRSDDAGATWTELGLADQQVNDLALGIDGRNLYAATRAGVWRLVVGP